MAIQGLIGFGGGATGLACAGALVYDVDFLVIAGGGSGAGGLVAVVALEVIELLIVLILLEEEHLLRVLSR